MRIRYDGDTLFVRDHLVDPVPLSDDVIDRMIDTHYAGWTGTQSRVSRERFREAYRAAVGTRTPPSIPPVSKVITATDGSSWLRREDRFDGGPTRRTERRTV